MNKGILCFTFDDRNFEGWLSALPVFERYNAHASFFISGEIDADARNAAKKLHDAGHTVGLHTKNHADAPEYFEKNGAEAYYENEIAEQKKTLEEAGIRVTAFAYPNNRRNEETDAFLGKYFTRFRAGNSKSEEKYFSVDALPERRVMQGFGIGEYYSTVAEELYDKIRTAANENMCMTFFSHNIAEDAVHIHMPLSLLESALKLAQEKGVRVLGFDEL